MGLLGKRRKGDVETLTDVAQALNELTKQVEALREDLDEILAKSMRGLREEIRDVATRHMKLLDELNDAYHELAEGEVFLGEITPDDARDPS